MFSQTEGYTMHLNEDQKRDDLIVGIVTPFVPVLMVVILVVTFWLIARN